MIPAVEGNYWARDAVSVKLIKEAVGQKLLAPGASFNERGQAAKVLDRCAAVHNMFEYFYLWLDVELTFRGFELAAKTRAQDIVNVSIQGTFLPFEDVYVTIVSTRGARVGPLRMTSSSPDVAAGADSRAALLGVLAGRRSNTWETRTAALALPDYIARSDLARFEFSRSFRTFSYRLALPSSLNLGDLAGYLSVLRNLDVTLTAADLEGDIRESGAGAVAMRDVVN
jgi:hypothetical protein